MSREFSCPKCWSVDTTWRGYRYNKSGKKRLRQCKGCGTKFTPDDGFLRMRYKKEIIIEAVGLYNRGLSLSAVADHLWQHHNTRVSRWAILLWVRKYSKLLKEFVDGLKPEIKGNVHADEVILKVKGKRSYYWGAKDRKTKFKLASEFTKDRVYIGTKRLFFKLKHGCRGTPPKIIADKLGHYQKAFNKYFYRTSKFIGGVPIACKRYGLGHNNNCAERDNERIKQRYKVMRGFGSFESAKDILSLIDICYNFVNPHMGLGGRTPAEEAGLDLKLGRNKLMDLVKR